MWCKIIISLTLITLSFQASAAPMWSFDSNFKCGKLSAYAATFTAISTSTSTGFNYNVVYAASFSGSNPQVSLGVVTLQSTTASNSALYFLANIGAQSLTGFTAQIGLNSACAWTSMKLSYFAKTSSYSYMFVDYQSVTSKHNMVMQ